MSEIQDDKAQYCIPFILERLEAHRQQHEGEENAPPFFLGLNGVQGAGKTVLVTFFPLLRSIPTTHSILGLYNPINTPIPTAQPPHHRLLPRRPLPHPRRPGLTRPIPPAQPSPPTSRPALNPRHSSRSVGLLLSFQKPTHPHTTI
jgi:hypothetical protein